MQLVVQSICRDGHASSDLRAQDNHGFGKTDQSDCAK